MLQLLKAAFAVASDQRDEREESKSVPMAHPNKIPDYDALRAEVVREFRKTLAYLAK